MPVLAVPLITNHLVNLLSEKERVLLLQHCDVVALEFGAVLCEPRQRYRYLYFPLSGFISLVTKLAGHKPLEIGLIGNEGMLGVTLALGITTAPMQAVVQGKGTAWRIDIAALQQLLHDCPQLQNILQQYLYVLMAQLSQSTACAHFHELEYRLARWLLMSHDRAHSNDFHLTHQFLADMLGVRRSGVTVAAGILQQKQYISYSRGMISILNRPALQHAACECYQVGIDNYRRLLGEPVPDSAKRLLAEQGTP
ncbi:cAMP-binding domain of CRP or a regulatory subunit of cAMP-dependent protein kinases [Rheinheimera pacifica]|uniref:cAMP-binding domain of CRP or a regulatory subunit of cAMP-dependent protein kinases n=1 Tax=Rheinheimera pacifica TaxID=173990 RepID=A0A1H6N408_9GAMM|nr:Crp/Fnr family transcriptional regulator [Rheinheimera pacifica]SEI05031.1 cAMP-binding domain of CRP or a regulatory subunit of cAMP-dependent protein kinases [Rheinheimera pacifica]